MVLKKKEGGQKQIDKLKKNNGQQKRNKWFDQ